MTGIDRDRLAEALRRHHRFDLLDGPDHQCGDDCAPLIAGFYDRLTQEWREHMGSGPYLAPSAIPTRGKGKG